MRRITLCTILMAGILGLASSRGQDFEFYKKPTNVPEYWRAISFEVGVGKYEIAAQHIKGLLDLNPKEADLLTIEKKDGMVAFLKLRNVERWTGNRQEDKDVRANVEKLIGLVSDALKKELSNPDRITKFAKNLLAPTPEETAFAMKELTRSGIDAIPVLLSLAQGTPDARQRAAIFELLPDFDLGAMPPLVASLEVADSKYRADVLDSLAKRSDLVAFPSRVDLDLVPILWNMIAPERKQPDSLRAKAAVMLRLLIGKDPLNVADKERATSQWHLTQIGRRFYEHKARFPGKDRLDVWRFEGGQLKMQSMPFNEAEEYYGLRYLRWALEIQPENVETQKLFLNLAFDKHFQRTGLDTPLAKSNPALHGVLAASPYEFLTEMLEQSMLDNKVPQALVMIQAIADRAEIKAARPSERSGATPNDPKVMRPPLLVKALDYPDRRVQFAAADALLRIPGPPSHQRTSQIVKLLSGALKEQSSAEPGKPKAMIADPDRERAQALAGVLRRMGYVVLIRETGKDAIRTMQADPNYDLLLVDHHIIHPQFPDFAANARADFRIGAVPMVVIASGDQPTSIHPLTLLARLATIISVEEQMETHNFQGRDGENLKRDEPSKRFNVRLERLKKAVASLDITLSPELEDRLEYFLLRNCPEIDLDLPPEYLDSRLAMPPANRRARLRALQPRVALDQLPFLNVKEKTQALTEFISRIENNYRDQTKEPALIRAYWKAMQEGEVDKQGRVIVEPLPTSNIRNMDLEAKLKHLTRAYKRTRVIPEVLTELGLKEELLDFVTFEDPKETETVKKANAKTSLEWLRKMTIGELPGYPYLEAEASIRSALQSPELAPLAIDAVSRFGSKEAQQDLASVVLGGGEPPTRQRALEALIGHIQLRGNMLSQPQQKVLFEMTATEANVELRAKLVSLRGMLIANPKQIGSGLIQYTPPAPMPKEPKEPKEEPKQ